VEAEADLGIKRMYHETKHDIFSAVLLEFFVINSYTRHIWINFEKNPAKSDTNWTENLKRMESKQQNNKNSRQIHSDSLSGPAALESVGDEAGLGALEEGGDDEMESITLEKVCDPRCVKWIDPRGELYVSEEGSGPPMDL
jgi:hypothetical protein